MPSEMQVLAERLLQLANDEGTAQIHDAAIEISRLTGFQERKIRDLRFALADARAGIGGADAVLSRETMDGMSRSIQRLRSFSEQDFPPILVTRELDLLEKLLANLRTPVFP